MNDGSAVLLSLYSNAIVSFMISMELCGCAFRSNPPLCLSLLLSQKKDLRAKAVTSHSKEIIHAVAGEVKTM